MRASSIRSMAAASWTAAGLKPLAGSWPVWMIFFLASGSSPISPSLFSSSCQSLALGRLAAWRASSGTFRTLAARKSRPLPVVERSSAALFEIAAAKTGSAASLRPRLRACSSEPASTLASRSWKAWESF